MAGYVLMNSRPVLLFERCFNSRSWPHNCAKSQELFPPLLSPADHSHFQLSFCLLREHRAVGFCLWGGAVVALPWMTCLPPGSSELTDLHLGGWGNNNAVWHQKLGAALGEGTSAHKGMNASGIG